LLGVAILERQLQARCKRLEQFTSREDHAIMNRKLVTAVTGFGLVALSSAQLTGFRVRAGYGWSGAINTVSGSRHMNGPELGVDFPLTHLPLVEVNLTGDVLLGGQLSRGGDLDGNVYRFLLSARAQIPGSKVGVFGGVGWGTAQARGGEFGSFSGSVMQLGVSVPLGASLPLVSPSLEVAGTTASKSGLSGFSVSLAVKF
jgi:hypothetical protein